MRELGLGLFLVGMLSLILPFLGLKLMFLAWTDHWGAAASWAIRGGAALLGLALYLANRDRD